MDVVLLAVFCLVLAVVGALLRLALARGPPR